MRKGKFGKNAYEQGSHSDCCQGEVVANWTDNNAGFSGAAKFWDEPIQGCAKDCFFIAALKAVAYKAGNTLTSTGTTFSFLNTETMQNESITLADKKLAYTADNRLVYARSKTGNRWPMLYEKAYALWFDSRDTERCWDAVDPTQPDIKCISEEGGNGVTAMMNITRYKKIFEKQPIAFAGNTVSYPTVAATADIDPTQLRLPDQLTRKHTYSINRKDSTYYYLIDPCNNSEKKVALANLTTNKFDTWGYVRL